MPNGNAEGACGQIVMGGWDIEHYALGWYTKRDTQFQNIWKRWHLNDMRPNCEHQVGPEWTAEDVELVTYGLSAEGYMLHKEALQESERAAIAGEVAELNETGRMLLTDVWYKPMHTAPDTGSPLAGLFEVKKREVKSTGWLYENQHPRGFLNKACPVCGYKYGSAWKKETVPESVLTFLRGLPDTDITPAWV
ncbi:MAG: hypothetical protein ACYC36_02485 [Bellilinea sp.]